VKAFLAIVTQTMRSAIRSKIFHVLFALIILAMFLLPVTVSGDGTAVGLVQISLTYSLGVVVTLISTTTLWLACSQLSREIEAYNIHLVVSKPCPRWKVWLGKWFGIFIMHAVILVVSATVIFALIAWRVNRGNFSTAELARLDKEIRVGRRGFFPQIPEYDRQADAEYERRQGEFDANHDVAATKAEIKRQIIAKAGEVPPGAAKVWLFKNVAVKSPDDPLFLRYRVYSGSTSSTNQKQMPCIWGLRDPAAPPSVADPFVNLSLNVMGGTFQEMPLNAKSIDELDNSVTVRYINPPQEYWQGVEATSAVFQPSDGPVILVAVSSFGNNYARAMLLALLQLAFLAALGCTVSAAFSTPVAAFVAVAYLVIGLSIQAAITAPLTNDDGSYRYKNVAEMAAHKFAQGLSHVIVSVDDLDATSDLIRGRLIENRRLLLTFASLFCLRTGLIAAIGVWIFTRRELGAVIRK
jgi:ABC-type transport system involved in multi-copper enzyme maturation permease subunit